MHPDPSRTAMTALVGLGCSVITGRAAAHGALRQCRPLHPFQISSGQLPHTSSTIFRCASSWDSM